MIDNWRWSMFNRQLLNKAQKVAVSDTTGDAINSKAHKIRFFKKSGPPKWAALVLISI